ncbi:hypothetical protein CCS01_22465 [Rhodopila globiformis]|uniref:Type II toxin-antitoxin system RelE/ParE family toxin n=1 Tax=Rhodopila globiformis TaxID=1071 RepID=A0A2S6N3G4_RHOGL|nr:hypothetical protein CCS01_22465 [Rhodopila globiformis]
MVQAYQDFGDQRAAATERAAARIREAFDYLQTLATHPHRGTVHPELRGGIRHVTDKNFVYYFEIDERLAQVTVLAIFFGGQDHRRQIAERLVDVPAAQRAANRSPD